MPTGSQQQRSRNTRMYANFHSPQVRVCSLFEFCCYSLHRRIKRKCLCFVHEAVIAYMVQRTCTCAEGSGFETHMRQFYFPTFNNTEPVGPEADLLRGTGG
jgi:hypothetical protein